MQPLFFKAHPLHPFLHLPQHQCDQIWRNFATTANLQSIWANIKRFIEHWAKFNPSLAKILLLGNFYLFWMTKYRTEKVNNVVTLLNTHTTMTTTTFNWCHSTCLSSFKPNYSLITGELVKWVVVYLHSSLFAFSFSLVASWSSLVERSHRLAKNISPINKK